MNRANYEEIEIGISGIRRLTEVVKQGFGFDLSVFAGTSLKRRISRIIHINDLKNLDDLINVLTNQPSFFSKFQFQLVVEGTEFFRDPAFWRSFRDDICKTLRNNHTRIKIWLPGCSTGEEVITTAIVLTEAGLYDNSEIIATDMSREIIDGSRSKVYSNALLEISENNFKRFREDEAADLSKYCIKGVSGFTFSNALYQNIRYDIFNEEDTKNIKSVNMILYRNKFIYYTSQYMDKLMDIFSDKLVLNGFFAIGNKESINNCKDFSKYVAINEVEKIYKKAF